MGEGREGERELTGQETKETSSPPSEEELASRNCPKAALSQHALSAARSLLPRPLRSPQGLPGWTPAPAICTRPAAPP